MRGANGVIIITTKKAKEGQTRVNINGSFGFKAITNKIAMVDADGFKLLYNEQLRNEGNPEYNFSDWTGNTNWQDEIFQTGFITKNNNMHYRCFRQAQLLPRRRLCLRTREYQAREVQQNHTKHQQ